MKIAKYLSAAILTIIIILGLSLRLYRLDQAPVGALVDEMSFGYIAYSLLETGADEHGHAWPLIFKAFGDYKLPGYAYLLVPFVAIFDLSVFTIRLPSVLLGTLNILLIFYVARSFKLPTRAALVAAAIMAFSPWPFILSRFGFESNLGLTLWLVALYLLNTIQSSSSLLRKLLVGCMFGLTWYAYIAYRPMTLVILLTYFGYSLLYKKINSKSVASILIAFLLTISPMLLPGISSANTVRFNQISIFNDPGIVMLIDEQRTFCSWQISRFWCDVIWNKPVVIATTLVQRYVKTFSVEYLATTGESDAAYLTVTGFGVFSYVVYLLFILGVVYVLLAKEIFGQKVSSRKRLLLIVGILFSVIPSAISGQPQRVRLSVVLPFFIIFTTYGLFLLEPIISTLYEIFVKSHKFEKYKKFCVKFAFAALGIVFVFNSVQYFVDYFYVYTAKKDYEYNTYLASLMPYLAEFETTHKIYIRPFFPDPIMYYAFYTKYDPATYQKIAVLGDLEASGFQHTITLNSVELSEELLPSIACAAVANDQKTLYVTNLSEGNFPPQYIVRSTNGATIQAYVYDLLLYGKKHIDGCPEISPALKARVKKELAMEYPTP